MNENTEFGSASDVRKPVIFKLSRKRSNPATQGNHYPGILRIPSTDEIYDPATNTRRAIRYSESEQSVFKDEQPVDIVLSDIIFTNGSIRVNRDNPVLLQYLRLCNWNKDNTSRVKGKSAFFYEYDPEKIAAEKLEVMDMEIESQYTAKNMDFDKLRAIARALNMNIDVKSKELRHDMVMFAKNKPREFMTALTNPELARRVDVQEAEEAGILKFENRMVHLLDSKGKAGDVCTIPVGVDPIDHFVSWTMTTKDGEEFFEKVVKAKMKMFG